MKEITFGELKVDDIFIYNGTQYKKTNKIKVSCCRFNNATSLSDPTKKMGFTDIMKVNILEEDNGATE